MFSIFSSKAQTLTEKNNVDYKKTTADARAAVIKADQKITSPLKMMKEADFTLYTFPAKGTNYISVNDALPNALIKVVAYDVSGKVIFLKEVTANSYGQSVINIDPMINYKEGTCFVAALYNNQAYYETTFLSK
jgi:hypothetical protein